MLGAMQRMLILRTDVLTVSIIPMARYAKAAAGVSGKIYQEVKDMEQRVSILVFDMLVEAVMGLGKKGKGKAGGTMEKKTLPVETDPVKLCTHVCGSNIYKEGEDVKLKPDSEYPSWLWQLRLGPPPPLEELDPETLYYWLRVNKLALRRRNQLSAARRLKFLNSTVSLVMMAEQDDLFDDDKLRQEDSPDELFASAVQSQAELQSPDDKTDVPISSSDSQTPHLQDEVPLNDDSDLDILPASDGKPKLELSYEPLKQVEKGREPASGTSSGVQQARVEEGEKDDHFIEVVVTEPQKVGEGMSSYIIYKVETKTNLPFFRRRSMSVSRRFSDFLGLHDRLEEKYLHAGRIIPPAPEKSVIGMTKIKMSNSETAQQGSSAEFLERRRAALERYLNRTAAHPTLKADPDFREFLEAEGELPKTPSALSGAGVLGLFKRVGETVNKITYKMEESDPWFEDKVLQIESLDSQLRKLHTSVEALAQYRKELASNTSIFSRSAALLSNCEEHSSLARALSQLSELEEKMEMIHSEQANADFFLLSELLKDYIGLMGAVKAAFHERVKTFQMWQHAQQTLVKKRENKARMELAGRTDRVAQAKEEVTEWEAKVERCQEEFESISKTIKTEMTRFDENRVMDFRNTIIKYLETLLRHQQQIMKYWEAFLPEAKSIM
ncbi:unnamed protein product [Darwinula stevensoni]|uniref:PX domain-containing protein n=1 Tax=Darwinula stevensoni TaxID=69355 RepID=A0A7R8XC07_9CRUS|nr:unnamed protein product [Darwinula stevensoni]CAG0891709.1 unnamed protein product [Darwinula stevensoni]